MCLTILQDLGQSGISLIKKHQLKEKYEKLQSDFAAVVKAKSAADQKMVRASQDFPLAAHALRSPT